MEEEINTPTGKETQIEIKVNGKYSNINFKDIESEGDFIIVKKHEYDQAAGPFDSKFMDKKGDPKKIFNATVEYGGEPGTLSFLTPAQAEEFASVGGLGDDIYVFWEWGTYEDKVKGTRMQYKSLRFASMEE